MFIGPYEHHSNELPWRESSADVVTVREGADGRIDVAHLEHELRRHAHRALKLGSFSAASNVTGIVSDVERIASVLRRHGALACFDYAAAGPHLPIDMDGKDAVFLSPHKFAGGPGTPGVLVAKRALLRPACRSVPGGGTILFVSPTGHTYHPDPATREEGGTPAIVESIRAGLVFALKEAVGAAEIRRREQAFARRALRSWGSNPRIEILGNPEPSGSRSCPSACATRAGCCTRTSSSPCSATCSGSRRAAAASAPARTSIAWFRSTSLVRADARAGPEGCLGATLGFARVSFDYFMSEAVFDYVLEAVHLVANEGAKLLPQYRFEPRTGSGTTRAAAPGRSCSLRDLAFGSPAPAPRPRPRRARARAQLDEARRIIRAPAPPPPATRRCRLRSTGSAGSRSRARRAGPAPTRRRRRGTPRAR